MENVCVNTIAAPAEFLIIQRDRLLLDLSAVPTERNESSFDSTQTLEAMRGGSRGSRLDPQQQTELRLGQIWFSLLVAAEWLGARMYGLGGGRIQVGQE